MLKRLWKYATTPSNSIWSSTATTVIAIPTEDTLKGLALGAVVGGGAVAVSSAIASAPVSAPVAALGGVLVGSGTVIAVQQSTKDPE